jgi:hypothetical protein
VHIHSLHIWREKRERGENCEQQPSENPVDFKYEPLR